MTGSTSGIGFAIAKSLAAEGVHVFVNGRSAERVEQAITSLQHAVPGASALAASGDVATAAGVDAVVAAADEIDILINNTGIFEPKPFESIPDADWLRFFEVNVMSGVRLSRHYFPKMKANDWGRIVFISSESGLQIPAEMIHYGMTKTAQLAVARGLAELTTSTRVTVNSVLPGPTMSEGVDTFVEQIAQTTNSTRQEVELRFFQKERATSLIKRFIEPAEIAAAVTFLCSPLAAAINGSAMRVEGGVVKSIG